MGEVHKASHLSKQILHLANGYNVFLKSYKVATNCLADVEKKNLVRNEIFAVSMVL